MPEAFSPSRSLKYWRITLRTVEDSSLSRTSPLPSFLVLCCKGDLFVVLEALRALGELVEEPRDGLELQLGALQRVHARAEDGRVLESLGIPTDVLAGHARAPLHAVEGVEIVQVPHQHLADLRDGGRRQVRPRFEEMGDLAEDPRAALGGAADHDRVGARV